MHKDIGQSMTIIPVNIPKIDNTIPLLSNLLFEQSQEGNKEKHDKIIPTPGLKKLYNKIIIPNL
jgi:hypothetical protein